MGTAAPDPSNELATAAAPPKRGNRVKGLFRFVYGLIRVVLILFLALLAAGTAIEFVVPKGPLRKLCVQRLQARLHRQVAIAAVSIGPWRGLNVEGLQVSEAPDFGAGTFFKSERVMVRPRFLPLLAGRVVVGRVLLVAPQLRVVRDKTGRYNFGSLVEASVAASTAAAKPSFDRSATCSPPRAERPRASSPPRSRGWTSMSRSCGCVAERWSTRTRRRR